jgi:hypothetical protein
MVWKASSNVFMRTQRDQSTAGSPHLTSIVRFMCKWTRWRVRRQSLHPDVTRARLGQECGSTSGLVHLPAGAKSWKSLWAAAWVADHSREFWTMYNVAEQTSGACCSGVVD